jgi:hypothetical protein
MTRIDPPSDSPWSYGQKAEERELEAIYDELLNRPACKVELPVNHPYLLKEGPFVQQIGGRWRVRWRDFLSIKQDADFGAEEDARAFAERVRRDMRLVDLNILDDAGLTFAEAEANWL